MVQQGGSTRGKHVKGANCRLADTNLEARCIGAARQLSNEFRKSFPPFPIEPLLERFEVTEIRERPLDRDACLRFDSGSLYVEVNSLYSLATRRAAIAHEIGHLIVSKCMPDENSHWGHHDREIENLCDRLGGELLAPGWAVRKFFGNGRGRLQGSFKRPTLRKAALLFGLPVGILSLCYV